MASAGPQLIYPLRYATRLRSYNYSQGNYYAVTVCVHDRQLILGTINDDKVALSRLGEIVAETWISIPRNFKGVELDSWVVMPNHLHGIVILTADGLRGSRAASTSNVISAPDHHTPVSLTRVLNVFKSISGKLINRERSSVGAKVWQRSFYDHIVRDQRDLDAQREYIVNNPLKWALDEENPESETYKVRERRRGS